MTDYRDALAREWRRRTRVRPPPPLFPLIADSFDHHEIAAAVEVLLSGQLTMGECVRRFELEFARVTGAPHAVMVNSGSSANLLAVAACASPSRRRPLRPGDEVLVPAVCWSTSVWPLVQHGLVPVFVDVDPATLNADLDDLTARLTPRTRAIMAVHVLGNATDVARLCEIATQHGLLVLEDTCESLGTTASGRMLGTFGDFGTYSFYYSHHITTGEGGMVVCRTAEERDLLRSLRAHGWSRELADRAAVERQYDDVDPRFLFLHAGYNLRPLDLQGAIGLVQLGRLASMNKARNRNRERILEALRAHPQWDGRFAVPEAGPGIAPAWFGFACLLQERFRCPKAAFLQHLARAGVENRPIIGGNFTRQPGLQEHGIHCDPAGYPGAEAVHQGGFFIGLHAAPLPDSLVMALAGALLAPVGELGASIA